MFANQLQGSTTITVQCQDEEKEHILTVYFDYREWSEGHPYGSTTAYEHLCETSNQSYELDGRDATYEELAARFGSEVTDKAIERAEEDGISKI